MPEKGIDIPVEVSGTERGRQNLDSVGEGVKGVAGELESASRPTSRLGRVFDNLVGQAKGLVVGFIGAGGLLFALNKINQKMLESEQVSRKFATSIRDLIFLSQNFNAGELTFVGEQAIAGRRDPNEVAKAFATFKSQTANLSEKERFSAFGQVVESGRTTSGSLESIGTLFSSVLNLAKGTDPAQLQNLVRQTTIESTETDVTKISRALAEVLGPGLAAGLNLGEIGGLTAFAGSQAGGDIAKGSTAARNILLSLVGEGTPKSTEILSGRGVSAGDDFFSILSKLQGLTLAQQEVIAGSGNVSVFGGFLTNQESLRATIKKTENAFNSKKDLTAEAISNMLAESELFREDESLRALEALNVLQQVKPESLRRARRRLAIEVGGREAGRGPVDIVLQQFLFDLQGADPKMLPKVAVPLEEGIDGLPDSFNLGNKSNIKVETVNNGTQNFYQVSRPFRPTGTLSAGRASMIGLPSQRIDICRGMDAVHSGHCGFVGQAGRNKIERATPARSLLLFFFRPLTGSSLWTAGGRSFQSRRFFPPFKTQHRAFRPPVVLFRQSILESDKGHRQ